MQTAVLSRLCSRRREADEISGGNKEVTTEEREEHGTVMGRTFHEGNG